jgi:D-alanine transaminase
MNSNLYPLPETICYLNGVYGPIKEAKISVLDRGFIFGDGVYEVVPVYGGKPFRFASHMQRLDRSLKEVRIANPLSFNDWSLLVSQLIRTFAEQEGLDPAQTDQIVYIQISRGVAMRDHAMPGNISPTLFAMTNPLKPASPEQRLNGVHCVSADDFRWSKAHIKSTSLLAAVLARQISADVGATETVMFREGFLSEASSSNVWVVKNGTVQGPPKDNLVLEGIRYGLIEELCHAEGIPFKLKRISRDEVLAADELILSSATKEVLPIAMLDGQKVGHGIAAGKPGPIYSKLYAAYQAVKGVL